MQLYRLVYYSEAAPELGLDDVAHIAEKSSKNNQRRCLTGSLLYCEGKFLQALEGGIRQINNLYRKIMIDPRHINVSLIEFSPIQKRAFETWDMSLVFFPSSQEFLEEYIKYSHVTEFDPMYLSGSACTELLKDLLQKRRHVTHLADIQRRSI